MYGAHDCVWPFGNCTVVASLQVADEMAHLPCVVSHLLPCEHSVSLEQVFRHTPLALSQPYGAHGVVPPTAQAPVPSHVDALVDTSPVQLAALHVVALPG